MSGVAIIMQQLLADAAVHGIVAERVLPHEAREDTTMPCVVVTTVSRFERAPVDLLHSRARVTERVQVTPMVSADAPHTLRPLLAAARRACRNKLLASVAGVSEVVIRPEIDGPQLRDERRHLDMTSTDFMVSFNEPTS